MAFAIKYSNVLPVALVVLMFCVHVDAFGAGNIGSNAKIEGSNFRHGDIEDTLLTILTARAMGGKKFSKLDVKRVYFGNWLRDYSQAIDVGTVKYVSAEAIRILLWVLGFLTFGYGTAEFEVTRDRLGCYRPEEHIDNPKDYADNMDAQQYDRRLRGRVDERRELSIDERNGLKAYIASEDKGITTSAGLVRNLFGKAIDLGRRYKQSRDDRDYYEALRLMGTGCHCLEDYSAHSNYVELALIELGERDVFPHVGRRTQIELRGARNPVYPIVTGTFGGVDFLHSVLGELGDKAKQSELQQLEGTLSSSQLSDTSVLKELLNKLPPGILGGDDKANKADELQANAQAASMQSLNISPKEPEEFTRQVNELVKEIYPILEFHDGIVKSISQTIDNIPVLPELVEQITTQVSLFVFQLLSPIVVPIIKQVKNELSTGSEEIINSSKAKQHIVFSDDNGTDPTHSMLSKDHFSNVLNEPAGRVASSVLTWVVPQIVACWDDDSIEIPRTLDRIINGVFHHPALREGGNDGARDGRMTMFGVVEQWWRQMGDDERDDLRRKLSRDGVENGHNHKEGVEDTGHGCCKPLGLGTMGSGSSSGGLPAAAVLGGINQVLSGQSIPGQHDPTSNKISSTIGDALGGGALGSVVGGLAGGLLGTALSGGAHAEKTSYQTGGHNEDGSYTSQYTEAGHRPSGYGQPERYGQASLSQTQYPSGGYREDYKRYEQDGHSGSTGYGFQQSTEVHSSSGGGYEQRTERRYEQPGGRYESETQVHGVSDSGRQYGYEERRHGNKNNDDDDSNDDSNDDDDWEKKERKRKKKEEKRRRKQQEEEERSGGGGGYGRRHDEDEGSSGYGRQSEYGQSSYSSGRNEYGREERSGDGYGQQSSYGRRDEGESYGSGRRDESYNEYGSERRDESYNEYGSERRDEEGQGYGYERREDEY